MSKKPDNRPVLNELYDMIDSVRRINDQVRDLAFNSKREDLWRTYEVGHNAQLALASYVVAIQNLQEPLGNEVTL